MDSIKLKEEALDLLPLLKNELGDLAEGVSDTNLLKFLHWKQDVQRASQRFRDHIQWRKDNSWSFDKLLASEDDELKRILKGNSLIAPESMTAKDGGSVLVGRMRNNDMSDGRTPTDVARTIIYLIDRILEREEAQIHGVHVFHDMKELSRNNVHPTIPKLILKAIIGNFPLRIKGIYILNAPWFFKAFFSTVIVILFPKKLKERTHFINSLDDVYKFIDKDKLLEEHGGTLDFDTSMWVEEQCEREINGDFDSLRECVD